MTFEELERELPSGFHDDFLHDLKIDLVNGTAVMHMALDYGDYNDTGPSKEDYRAAKLQVTGLYFCSIGPPSPDTGLALNREYVPRGYPLCVKGDSGGPGTMIPLEPLLHNPPPGITVYRFFVEDWRSCIIIAARDVQITWLDGGETTEE